MINRPPLEEKRVFLLATPNAQLQKYFQELINQFIKSSVVFTAHDGQDALFKLGNVPPHIIVVESNLPKLTGYELALKVINNTKIPQIALIILGEPPDDDRLVEAVVAGQVQFLTDLKSKDKISYCLKQALNFISNLNRSDYRVRFLGRGDVLFREGEVGESAFIVKSGQLTARRNNEVIGAITAGEFVGEMAHINSEPRVATVEAIEDCELIEIPFGRLDIVLFRKPLWAKALIRTLSRRLKQAVES